MIPLALSFHEATVESIQTFDDVVLMIFSDVTADMDKVSVEVVVRGVKSILVDGESRVGNIEMEHPDGEVLSLECSPSELSMIVQWNDFARRLSLTRSYKVTADVVAVTVAPGSSGKHE